MKSEDYTIQKVESRTLYEGLRDLWCRVFGDEPAFVDALYGAFGEEVTGYVATDPAGKVVSALTCYKCGTYRAEELSFDEYADDALDASARDTEAGFSEEMFTSLDGMPVYVSYAVCTDPDYRDLGLAGELTKHVMDLVTQAGGISLVSPAEGSLIRFYKNLGYTPHFYASEGVAFGSGADPFGEPFADPAYADDPYNDPMRGMFGDPEEYEMLEEGFGGADVYEWGEDDDDEFEAFDPGLSVAAVDAGTYNRYREAFLAGKPHIELSGPMLEFVRAESKDGDGLLVINGGDAICTLMADNSVAELLINPMLMELSMEIDMVIAAKLAKHLGAARIMYRTPGRDRCQSMIAAALHGAGGDAGIVASDGMSDVASDGTINDASDRTSDGVRYYDPYEVEQPAYFGFPID